MNIRVTTQTQTANALANLRRQAADVAKFQDQLSSGVKVKAASDSPATFAAITAARAGSKRAASYSGTLSDATTDLNAGVSALGEVNTALTTATQVALEGANGPTDAGGYEALAQQADTLLGNLLNSANRQQDGRYLFGGTATDAPPFQVATTNPDGRPAAIGYGGSSDRARAVVSKSQTVDTQYVGSQVFQGAGRDVFAAVIGLRDDLRNPALTDAQRSAALTTRVADLKAAQAGVGAATGEQSSALAGLDAISTRLQDLKLTADSRLGELEGTDYAAAVLGLRQQETAYQATVGVSAKLLQPSLLDFIR